MRSHRSATSPLERNPIIPPPGETGPIWRIPFPGESFTIKRLAGPAPVSGLRTQGGDVRVPPPATAARWLRANPGRWATGPQR
jgi:hypothetical protein